MEITTNRPINDSILEVIKDTLEESKGIKILNIFVEDNDVYGIYVNSLQDSLSFLKIPNLSINTDIDGHYITFVELGFLLRSIYYEGALSLYNWLLRNPDIACDTNSIYNDLIQCVKDNPPLYLAKSVIINCFDDIIDSKDKKEVLEFVQKLKDFNIFDSFDVSIDSNIENDNDMIRVKNQLSYFKQELQGKEYKKISEKKINDINDLYVSLQIFIYNR